MRVAGLGFRRVTTLSSLRDALEKAGGGATILATAGDRADSPALVALAAELGLSIAPVRPEMLAAQRTPTQSERALSRYGTGSLAEAAALAIAGRGARLLGSRVVSDDGCATAAIAEGEDE